MSNLGKEDAMPGFVSLVNDDAGSSQLAAADSNFGCDNDNDNDNCIDCNINAPEDY